MPPRTRRSAYGDHRLAAAPPRRSKSRRRRGIFLHQQLTSDVKHLAEDAAQHSAWCSAKGRMLASFLVFRKGPAYHLQLSADLLPLVRKRLQMFVLRSKVQDRRPVGQPPPPRRVRSASRNRGLRMAGLPIPAQPWARLLRRGLVIRLDDAALRDGRRARRRQPTSGSNCSAGAAGGRNPGLAVARDPGRHSTDHRTDERRVRSADGQLRATGRVSFHKGCYPGQEIVARTQYLGKVKRHLYRAHSASPMAAGQAIYSPANPEHPCGMIVNAAPAPAGGYDALAIVQEILRRR
jgi:folate-binding protein YgfZ